MEGQGTEVWLDGRIFTGQFKKGSRSGQGIMTYPNTQKQYRGPWLKNQKHGTGVEINLKVNT